MSVSLSPIGGAGWQFFDNDGVPLAGGKIYTYVAGTTTPQITYTSRSATAFNANPIILDAAGRTPQQIWTVEGVIYKYIIRDANDVLIRTWDDIGGTLIANNLQADLADTTDNALGDNLVGFRQSNAAGFLPGAVSRTVSTKLRESVSAADFGAVGDGITDDTAALKAAFDCAIPLNLAVELQGSYLVSGPIQPYATRLNGEMHIVCRGHVTITVSLAATPFRTLFYLETNAINNGSISGGQLEIQCNNLVSTALTFRHNATSQGGTVSIECPVSVRNCQNNDAAATYANEALFVFGDYKSVIINNMYVDGVTRSAINGACRGIAVAGLSGSVVINQPYVANVLTGTGTVDADGIIAFGKTIGTANNAKEGSCVINEPTFVNCQGRSFKGQISDVAIYRPRVVRTGALVTIAQATDFDFQFGSEVLLHEPVFEFYETGGVSPFSAGSSYSCVAFQQTLDNKQSSQRWVGGTIYTQVQFPRCALAVYDPDGKRSVCEINGLKIVPVGAFASSAVSRAILECRMDTVAAKADKTKIIVRNVEGPFINISAIGYTSYTSDPVNTKFSWEVSGCSSTLSGTLSRLFYALSGATVGEVEAFLIRDNYRFRDLFGGVGAAFSFARLIPGCKFSVDLTPTIFVTNAPSWGTNGIAYVEVLQQSFAESDVVAKVYVETGDKQSMRFFTRNGGTVWSSEVLFASSAASIADAANAVNTRNKLTGLQIYDQTNNRVLVASGPLPTSRWYVVDGSAFITPA